MHEALAFTFGALPVAIAWWASERRRPSASDAARLLGKRGAQKAEKARLERMRAHRLALAADLARERGEAA